MDGWVFAIGDQRTDVFGKGEVKRHGNNGGSEGVAANHQHSGGDATDERKWIHGKRRKSGSTLARPMTLQRFGSPPTAYCKAKPDWMAEPAAEIVGGDPRFM